MSLCGRSWISVHGVSTGGGHDAFSSALVCVLLHHDHPAGPGHSGDHYWTSAKVSLKFQICDTEIRVVQFVGLEALTTGLCDLNPGFFLVGYRRQLLLLLLSVVCFLIGLLMVTDVR